MIHFPVKLRILRRQNYLPERFKRIFQKKNTLVPSIKPSAIVSPFKTCVFVHYFYFRIFFVHGMYNTMVGWTHMFFSVNCNTSSLSIRSTSPYGMQLTPAATAATTMAPKHKILIFILFSIVIFCSVCTTYSFISFHFFTILSALLFN